jgi:Ca2+-binding EF-hand superfamily protein
MDLKKHLYTLACTVVAAGAVGSAQAGETAQNSWFKVLDWNSDGSVSLVELQAARNTRFFNMDSNADSRLSRGETAKNADWKARFHRLDSNGDGQVSLNEFESNGRSRFQAIDENRDGRITAHEALAFQRKVRQHWEQNLKARKSS